jgi:DNA-binding transcriptional LysR family regulator
VDLDLAQVRAFVAVVDHDHFGRAAQSLHITQQALSKRVARLESGVGVLLVRHRGGVALTPAGERFLPAARELLEVADRAVAGLREAPAPPLRVDVWSDVQTPAAMVRAIARDTPDLSVDLSMRRDLSAAIAALERHEVDLVFGNVANLGRMLPDGLSAELVATDPIAVLVHAQGPLAARDHVAAADLVRHGIWWPAAGTSAEVRGFAEEYAAAIGATLASVGSNLGVDALVAQVEADPRLVAPVVAHWPVAPDAAVRIVPLRPTPHYPWYATRRAGDQNPALRRLLAAVRAAGTRPAPGDGIWLPRGVEI